MTTDRPEKDRDGMIRWASTNFEDVEGSSGKGAGGETKVRDGSGGDKEEHDRHGRNGTPTCVRSASGEGVLQGLPKVGLQKAAVTIPQPS